MTRPKGTRLAVSERALIQRINRKLKEDGQQVRTTRSERMERQVGRHFIVDLTQNLITQQNVDIEALGRKLKVLQDWEELA